MPCQAELSNKDYLYPMHCNWCFSPVEGKKCSGWPECLFRISLHAETRNVRKATEKKQRRTRTAYVVRLGRLEAEIGYGSGKRRWDSRSSNTDAK